MARILFIGLNYYAYRDEICGVFSRMGHQVDYHPIEARTFLTKTFKHFVPKLYQKILAYNHRRMVESTSDTNYDIVLFLQVHNFSAGNVARLRQLHSSARFILYNWDSVSTHDYRPWLHLFDAAWTFDPRDSARLGIGYLPLFAAPRFHRVSRDRPKDFDLYFVGSVVTLRRFDAIARLAAFTKEADLKLKLHLVCSPAIRLMLARRRGPLPGLTLRPIDFDRIADLMERSRGVLDFANHAQSGYTMRFVENMCAGVKIVTDNERVLTEDFYRDDRFLVVGDADFSAIPAFLVRPITSTLDVAHFSIGRWAQTLLGDCAAANQVVDGGYAHADDCHSGGASLAQHQSVDRAEPKPA
jgi:hypothetical protein